MLMKTDELGIPRFTSEDLVDLIYNGNINKCHAVLCDSSEDIDKSMATLVASSLGV